MASGKKRARHRCLDAGPSDREFRLVSESLCLSLYTIENSRQTKHFEELQGHELAFVILLLFVISQGGPSMTFLFQKHFRPSNLDYPLYYMNNSACSCNKKYSYRLIQSGSAPYAQRRRIFCNSWRCEYCGPKKAKYLRERIITLSLEHGLHQFVTLTISDDSLSLKSVWDSFRDKVRKIAGGKFLYIWILGISEKSQLHLHALTNGLINAKALQNIWKQSGGGLSDVQNIYRLVKLADYLACNALSLSLPRKIHKVGCSKDIKLNFPSIRGAWEPVDGMTSLDHFPEGTKILSSKKDSDGNIVFCNVKLPYNRLISNKY